MKILGIDPGLDTTGWGVIENTNNKLQLLNTGEIKTDRKMREIDRLDSIFKQFKTLLKQLKPDYCVIEKYVQYRQKQLVWSAIILGKVISILYRALKDLDIDFDEFRAFDVKNSLVGNSTANKEQLRKAVNMILDTEVSSLHVSDALGVAIYYADKVKYNKYLINQVRG
jgi:crossover junction endodeoxyribonuclease RuvC